jgi:hypothetical protein
VHECLRNTASRVKYPCRTTPPTSVLLAIFSNSNTLLARWPMGCPPRGMRRYACPRTPSVVPCLGKPSGGSPTDPDGGHWEPACPARPCGRCSSRLGDILAAREESRNGQSRRHARSRICPPFRHGGRATRRLCCRVVPNVWSPREGCCAGECGVQEVSQDGRETQDLYGRV